MAPSQKGLALRPATEGDKLPVRPVPARIYVTEKGQAKGTGRGQAKPDEGSAQAATIMEALSAVKRGGVDAEGGLARGANTTTQR